jgi:hypothetical protein
MYTSISINSPSRCSRAPARPPFAVAACRSCVRHSVGIRPADVEGDRRRGSMVSAPMYGPARNLAFPAATALASSRMQSCT